VLLARLLGLWPGDRAAGVAVAVAAVGAGDQVVVAQHRDGADGDRLLAGVEVRGALDDVLAQQVIDRVPRT
jgi:hypothetical protein